MFTIAADFLMTTMEHFDTQIAKQGSQRVYIPKDMVCFNLFICLHYPVCATMRQLLTNCLHLPCQIGPSKHGGTTIICKGNDLF